MFSQEWFADQVSAGNGYVFESALAGVALIAAAGTNNKMLLVNPPNSHRVFVFQKITFGRTAIGVTPLEGSIVYNVGMARTISISSGPGNDVVSYTAVAGKNLRSGMGDNSELLFAPAASVVLTTPTFFGAPGIAQTADADPTKTGPQTQMCVDTINGNMLLFPGWHFSIGQAVTAVTTYHIAIYGISTSRKNVKYNGGNAIGG
jgi:hypothetical protein